jgi:hypothetical protein
MTLLHLKMHLGRPTVSKNVSNKILIYLSKSVCLNINYIYLSIATSDTERRG